MAEVDATSNELTRPLGVRRASAKPARPSLLKRLPVGPFLTLILAGGVLGAGGYAVLYGDPRGGFPKATAPIERRSAEPAPPVAQEPTGPRNRVGVAEVEAASGVAVNRPAGTAPPTGIVIRVPDEMLTGLARAPDQRLVETTRYGLLPKVGADGATPLQVYRRPTGPIASASIRRIAVVVGGLGISPSATMDAIAKLPEAVTLAFAPYGADLERSAQRAREAGHEILLQMPMEPFDYPDSDPGPQTLLASAKPAENLDRLFWAMGRLPGYVGIMNYMGGKLTADERALAPILREIGARGLGIVDDGSSLRSRLVAASGEVPAARAEIVLDVVTKPDGIDKALERLEAAAVPGGPVVVASASALPVTLERLARWAKGLDGKGIVLVPVSSALQVKGKDATR